MDSVFPAFGKLLRNPRRKVPSKHKLCLFQATLTSTCSQQPWKTLTKLQIREGRVWILQLPTSHVPPARPILNMPARFSIAPIWSKVSPHNLKIPHSHANNSFQPCHAGSVFIATISSCHTPLHCPSNPIKRDFVVLTSSGDLPHFCPGASSSPTTTHPHQHRISPPLSPQQQWQGKVSWG